LTLTLSSKTTHSDLSFEQMDGLRTRVGIEGFFCIVRNTPDFHMKPQWYTHYEEDIVLHYGIVLEGWTYDNFVNPSKLSSSVQPLKALVDAIENSSCKFLKLMAVEKKECEAAYQAKITSGEVQVPKRKRRKDAGVRQGAKRAQTGEGDDGEGDSDNDDDTQVRSKSVIEEEDDEDS